MKYICLLGIGIDDMFILISAWRYTSTKLSVEERIGQTLKSAAVSITITSVTDALAFVIGTSAFLTYLFTIHMTKHWFLQGGGGSSLIMLVNH